MFALTLADLLEQNLAENAARPFLIEHDETLTYGDVDLRARRLAAWMRSIGIRRGDRVGVSLHKCADEVVISFAAARVGAVFVNLFYQWTVGQLEFAARDCGIRLLFLDSRRARELAEGSWPACLERIVVKGVAPDHPQAIALTDLPKDAEAPTERVIDVDLAAILYTSGSSGPPKGVMLTHANLVQGARSVARYLENDENDRVLGLLPLCFDYGLNQITTMALVGGSVALLSAPMPAEIVKTLIEQKVTGFAGVPPTWIEVVRFLQAHPTSFPALRYITNSGGAIPKNILEAMPQVFPNVKIFLMYGLTEAFRSTYLPPDKFHEKMGSMGIPIPNVEVFVVDAEKGLCGADEPGELLHRGSLISAGYWGNPTATAEKFKVSSHLSHILGNERVLYSGDIVRVDADGYLWHVGRADALIKCSGVRVSPSEVEEVVYQSKLVGEAVAFAMPDELLGQVIHIIVSWPETMTGEADAGELLSFCKKHMPSYMVPREIHVWPGRMPRTASGKLDRVAVTAAFFREGNADSTGG